MDININNLVEVTLTDYGKEVYKRYLHARYTDVDIEHKIKAADPVLRTALWDIMHIFGQHLWMGNKQLFIDNRITVINKE